MAKRSTFKVGSGCYECCCCGKLTRDTHGEADLQLCARCNMIGDMENAYSDNKSLFGGCEIIDHQVNHELNDMKTKQLVELWDYIRSVVNNPNR